MYQKVNYVKASRVPERQKESRGGVGVGRVSWGAAGRGMPILTSAGLVGAPSAQGLVGAVTGGHSPAVVRGI
jgi:hypothetical protein